jgi:hypothetical protein
MIGLIIPNTVIGAGGSYPFHSPHKYINLCTEPAFDLVTLVEDVEFHYFFETSDSYPSCGNNFMWK